MNFTLTNDGIAAVVAATGLGPAIQILNFKVGNGSGYTPLPAMTALQGAVVGSPTGYLVSNYSAIDTVTGEWTCILEDTVGDFDFGEVGLYIDDPLNPGNDLLFALAAFPGLLPKNNLANANTNRYIFRARITAAAYPGWPAAVTFVINPLYNASIVEVPGVHSLLKPSLSAANQYLCGTVDDGGKSVNVFKKSNDEWSIDSYLVRLTGAVTGVSTTNSVVSTSIANELAAFATGRYLLQFTSGAHIGQIREITSQALNTANFVESLASAPSIADTFNIYISDYYLITIGESPIIAVDTTFAIPADFASINAFMEFMRTRVIADNVIVTLEVPAVLSEALPVKWNHPQSGQIHIDAPVASVITIQSASADDVAFQVVSGNTLKYKSGSNLITFNTNYVSAGGLVLSAINADLDMNGFLSIGPHSGGGVTPGLVYLDNCSTNFVFASQDPTLRTFYSDNSDGRIGLDATTSNCVDMTLIGCDFTLGDYAGTLSGLSLNTVTAERSTLRILHDQSVIATPTLFDVDQCSVFFYFNGDTTVTDATITKLILANDSDIYISAANTTDLTSTAANAAFNWVEAYNSNVKVNLEGVITGVSSQSFVYGQQGSIVSVAGTSGNSNFVGITTSNLAGSWTPSNNGLELSKVQSSHPITDALKRASVCFPYALSSASESPMGATLAGIDRYYGGVTGPDGKIYCAPLTATTILVIDPVTGTADDSSALGATFGVNIGYGCGALGADGKIYYPPAGSLTTTILVVDPATGTADNSSDLGATLPGAVNAYLTAVAGPNGKIYFIPFLATDIIVVDTTTTPATASNLTPLATSQYVGGCLGTDGKIYCVPNGNAAITILVIDTATDTFVQTHMGATIGAGINKWAGACLGADGKIYCLPTDATDFLIIDPASKTATNSDLGLGAGLAAANKYVGGVVGTDGKIYGIPSSVSNYAVINTNVSPAVATQITGGFTSGVGFFSGGALGVDGIIYGVAMNAAGILQIQSAVATALPGDILMSPYLNKF